jgi:hypothetical protein
MFQMLSVLVQHSGEGRGQLFLWGITFSALGDGCLVFKKVHIVGIISFGVSLCFYIVMLEFPESLANIGFGGVACAFGVFLLSLTIALVFRSQTKNARTAPLPIKSLYTAMIFLYFAILSTLLWSGAMLLLQHSSIASMYSAIGAAMFYVSDILIVASAIWDARLLHGRALVMVTYYTAQLCFAIYISLYMYT